MATGNMKDIKRRIKSIESTGQITKAMELVASSKLRKAKERAAASAPFFNALYETICDISSTNTELSSVYTKQREVKNVLYVVIAGERGLAGGYNSNIFKLVNAAILRDKKPARVLAIGKKATDHFEKRGLLLAGFPGVAENLDSLRVGSISEIIVREFTKGNVDEVYVYYTEFVSALSQVATEVKMLPLKDISSKETTEHTLAGGLTIYEPSAEEVFNAIVPEYVAGMLYGAVVESFASEQGARRTAMESASDNAQEIITKLSLSYNRARQAAITQEISEIVSGSQAG